MIKVTLSYKLDIESPCLWVTETALNVQSTLGYEGGKKKSFLFKAF